MIFQIHFHTSIGAALNEIQQQLDCARQLSCGESHISKFFLEKKSCTGDILDQLYVTREAIEAYERRTGFQGIGQFMIDKGLFVMAEENLCKTA